jgi:hypothetical protein
VVLACGGKKSNDGTVPSSILDGKGEIDPHTSVISETEATPAASSTTQPPLAPADACARVATLKGEGCAWAQRFPQEFSDPAVCVRSLELWFSPQTAGHDELARSAACWALDCDAAASCMIRVKSSQPPPGPRECGTDGTGSVYVDKATFAKRRGAEVRRFADIKTTEAEPVEVCGIDGEVAWMTRATCKGGTHPFPTPDSANEGRDSYMAKGGRCNSILDRYTVECPEETYTIHVDRYVCPTP